MPKGKENIPDIFISNKSAKKFDDVTIVRNITSIVLSGMLLFVCRYKSSGATDEY